MNSNMSTETTESIYSKNMEEKPEFFTTQLIRRPSVIPNSTTKSEVPKSEQLQRRRSTFKGIATSIKTMINMRSLVRGRLSITSSQQYKPVEKNENTYKMEPDQDKMVNNDKMHALISGILAERLKNEKYDAKRCSTLSCDLSSFIKHKVKSLNIPRYKFVCHVVIGQKCDQGTQVGSRCLWTPNTDTYQQVTYNNNSLFAVVTVFAVYFE